MGTTILNAFNYIFGVKNIELFHFVSKFDWNYKGPENWFAYHFDGIFPWFVCHPKK
jgi:hypothetical protein